MPNLLTRLFRREPEITRYTVNDYINWLTNNGRYGLTQPYGMPVSYARGKPAERIENSFEGYSYGAFKANPIVFGCMLARASVFSEARFMWRQIEDGRPGDLFSDDALDVLRRPWPNGTTGELLSRMIQDVDLAGNCYLVNEGDRLRRLRPDWVQIVLSGDPRTDQDVDVVGYVYTPGGPDSGDGRSYLPDEICHWSPIPDPDALYRGMSWLTPVIREIQGDSAAVDHKIAFFRNGATLGPIVKVPAGMTAAQFKEFVAAADAAHVGVENAYKPMYVGGGADVTLQAATMQQLDFKGLQGGSETRICVAARVPAVIAGVSEGLAGSSLNAGNYGTAKRSFGDGGLRPLWRSACAALMSILAVPANAELWFAERDIAFLRDDEQDIAQIQQTQASTVTSLITAGFKPESAVVAVTTNDFTKLEHTGLTSVQLMPPGSQDTNGDGVPDAEAQASADYEAALDEFRSVLEPLWEEIWRTDADEDEGVEDFVERADYYNVRVAKGMEGGGRFRKLSDIIGQALNDWLNGDGEADDPLEPFTREQLRKASKELGVEPRRGASAEEIKLGLLKDARTRFRAERGQEEPSHRLTLSSSKYRDQDVGVYQEKSGKVSLYRESSSGQRGSKVVTVASLAELEQWGRDNDEPQVAEWAAKERGGKAPVKKAAPRKAPPAKAAPRKAAKSVPASPRARTEIEQLLERDLGEPLRRRTPREGDVAVWSTPGAEPAIGRVRRLGNRTVIEWEGGQQERVALGRLDPAITLYEGDAPEVPAKSVPAKATPKPKREPLGDPAAKIASLRALGDVEAVRDDLDLHTVAELKILAGEVGVATSGRKRDVVDRITAKVGSGAVPDVRTKAGRTAVIVQAIDDALAGTEGNSALDFRIAAAAGSNREVLQGMRDRAAAGTFDDLDAFEIAIGRLKVRIGSPDDEHLAPSTRTDAAKLGAFRADKVAALVGLDRAAERLRAAREAAPARKVATPTAAPVPSAPRVVPPTRAPDRLDSLPDAARVLQSLADVSSREAARDRVASLKRIELSAIGQRLGIPAGLSSKRLQDEIVEATVGRRLDAATRRGFAGDRPEEVTPFDRGQSRATDIVHDATFAAAALTDSDDFPGDFTFRAIARRQGFDGPPTVVSREQMDRLIADGRPAIFRGVSETETDAGPMSAAQLQEQMRTGPYVPGEGFYGSGFYFGDNEDDVTEYYADRTEGSVARATLKSGARVVDHDTIQAEWEQFKADHETDGFDPLRSAYGSDLGRFAAGRGYDAIQTDDGIYVVLNRTALIVEAPDPEQSAPDPDGLDAMDDTRLRSYAAEFLDRPGTMTPDEIRRELRRQGVGSPEVEQAKRRAEADAAPELSRDPGIRSAQVRNRIIDYTKTHPGPLYMVDDIHAAMPDVSRDELRREIGRLLPHAAARETATIHTIQDGERVRIDADAPHVPVPIRDEPRAPSTPVGIPETDDPNYYPADPSERFPTPDDVIAREIENAWARIVTAHGRGAGDYAGLADIRDELGDRYPYRQVSRVLQMLNRGDALVRPENNQKALRQRDRDARVTIGNQSKHIITFDGDEGRAILARTDATRSAVEDFTTDESDDDPSIDDILAMAEDDEDVERAAGHDTTPGHDQLHHYWTVDPEGRAKWVDSPKPWTTLVAHLTRHVGLRKAKIFASRWFIEVFGYAAGSDANRVAHGHKPRGNRVGPG